MFRKILLDVGIANEGTVRNHIKLRRVWLLIIHWVVISQIWITWSLWYLLMTNIWRMIISLVSFHGICHIFLWSHAWNIPQWYQDTRIDCGRNIWLLHHMVKNVLYNLRWEPRINTLYTGLCTSFEFSHYATLVPSINKEKLRNVSWRLFNSFLYFGYGWLELS